VDVAAGHEMLAGAIDDHATNRGIRGQCGGVLDQAVDHAEVERIERLGPV